MKRTLTAVAAALAAAGIACAAPATASAAPGTSTGLSARATAAAATSAGTVSASSPDCPWLTENASATVKAEQVLANMTLAQKLSMMGGSPDTHGYAGYVAAIPSLCVPALKLEDNGSGVGDGVPDITALPDGEADSATWNTALMEQYGQVVGAEQKAKGTNVALGPMINIMRDPRWGRNYETFSEDPYLTSAAGIADVKGIQSQGVIATVKHIGAYVQEYDRTRVNSVVSLRALEEIYLEPFQTTIQQGGAGAIMAAADSTNGVYDNADPFLLQQTAKTDWGFPGLVMSDWDGAHSVSAATAGLDLSMPTPGNYGAALTAAVADGSVPLADINDHVERLLQEMFAHGLFQNPDTGTLSSPVTTAAHVAFALKDAEQSTVLLKNSGSVLPLSVAKNDSVAVIGAAGGTSPKVEGCGSGAVSATNVVSPLQGIQDVAGTSTMLYSFADGTDGWTAGANVSSVSAVTSFANGPGTPYGGGQALAASSAPGPANEPRTVSVTPASPLNLSSARTVSVWADGYGGAPGATGYQATFTLTSGSGSPLTTTVAINHDQWNEVSLNVGSWAGRSDITGMSVSYSAVGSTTPWQMQFQIDDVSWDTAAVSYADGSDVSAAASLAASSDVAVVFANDSECEQGGASYDDLTSLDLGSATDSLISAVAAANPRTIVVLDTGSPVTGAWMSQVPAIVEGWYSGQEDGAAIAAILYGNADPSGRLPQTWPASESQLPTSSTDSWGNASTDMFSEGIDVGYRWYQANDVTPLYPFGYGLSYTTFKFSNEQVTPTGTPGGTGTQVTATVTNTGSRTGDEVAQLYVGDPASTGEPPKQLQGFQKVQLKPGQSTQVSFTLDASNLRYWDSSANAWAVAPGAYQLYVGDSSADTPLSAAYTVGPTTGTRTVTVSAPSTIAVGKPVTVTTTLTAGGTATLHGAQLALRAPAGWQVQLASGPTSVGSVAPGQAVTDTWRVTAPLSASATLARLSGTAVFSGGTLSGAAGATVATAVSGTFAASSQLLGLTGTTTATLTLTSNAGVPLTASLSATAPAGVTAAVPSAPVTLAPGASVSVPVTLTASQAGAGGTVDVSIAASKAGGGSDAGLVVGSGDALLAVTTPDASLSAAFDNTGVTDDSATSAGNFDGAGYTYSAESLAADSITPGAAVSHDGLAFAWPDAAAGTPDNVQVAGQTIAVSGTGSTLGFLLSGTHGDTSGTVTVTYTDGSTQSFTLAFSNWTDTAPASGNDLVVTTPHWNPNGSGAYPVSLYGATASIDPGKTVAAVTLPSALAGGDGSGLQTAHVFAIAVGS
ncbi:MAG: Beta-glucosidase [Actinomycetia bacterium]|nr:Beta-glucosidase [Actinomycetes bacterium]